MQCRSCSKPLAKGRNSTGLCRPCWLADPEESARRDAHVRRLRLWEKGFAATTPEVRARMNASLSDYHLGHIPVEYRDLYRYFTRHQRMSKADATTLVMEQIRVDGQRSAVA